MRNERGSALLLVLFMVIIFSLLGMAVLSASIGGATRTETKQKDVQSLHLAEKALNEATAYIMSDFESQDGVNIDEVQERLENIKNKLNDVTTSTLLNEDVGSANAEIKGITFQDNSKNDSSKRYTIRIEAEATVNSVTRRLTQELTLDTFPDSLKYAMGSEGTVKINGSPYIVGDIYAGDVLMIKNEAEYSYLSKPLEGLNNFQPTKFPFLDGAAYVQKKEMEDGVRAYYCETKSSESNPAAQCDTNIQLNQEHSGYQTIGEAENPDIKTIEEVLNTDLHNLYPKDQSKFAGINVEEAFIDKLIQSIGKASDGSLQVAQRNAVKDALALNQVNNAPAESTLVTYVRGAGVEIIKPLPETEPPVTDTVNYTDYQNRKSAILSRFDSSSELSSTFLFDGDLTIDGGSMFSQLLFSENSKHPEKLDLNMSDWLIVNGDLTINATIANGVNIKANILVTGDLLINGTVNMDATIYAKGSTRIVDASILGLNDKELVLISEGPIDIYRVNSFRPIFDDFKYDPTRAGNPPTITNSSNPPVLKAFFYTDKEATLYGVGSVFWIYGGFFAKTGLTVNAVLGNADGTDEQILLDNQTVSKKERSRLIIDYNSQIFENQKVGLPRVSRVGLTVGKKKQVTSFTQ
jgi:Tfp pilus assembly protein PilX